MTASHSSQYLYGYCCLFVNRPDQLGQMSSFEVDSFCPFYRLHKYVCISLQLRFCFRASGMSCGNLLHACVIHMSLTTLVLYNIYGHGAGTKQLMLAAKARLLQSLAHYPLAASSNHAQ